MTTRSREARRRRSMRAPAVWRGRTAASSGLESSDVQHGVTGRSLFGARLFSALIVTSLSVVLFMFFSADAFYVRSINVGGLNYLTKEEAFAFADIANTHLFWLDPEEIHASLLRSPTVADATVEIRWPPGMVQIVVEERQPALVWEQTGVATWLDISGQVMPQREDRSDLLRISVEDVFADPLGPQSVIDREIVNGALQLQALFPNIDVLRYAPDKGLGYQDGRGWVAWFGIGTEMPEKISIYNAIVDDLLGRGIQPENISVANPDAPYYSILFERN